MFFFLSPASLDRGLALNGVGGLTIAVSWPFLQLNRSFTGPIAQRLSTPKLWLRRIFWL